MPLALQHVVQLCSIVCFQPQLFVQVAQLSNRTQRCSSFRCEQNFQIYNDSEPQKNEWGCYYTEIYYIPKVKLTENDNLQTTTIVFRIPIKLTE